MTDLSTKLRKQEEAGRLPKWYSNTGNQASVRPCGSTGDRTGTVANSVKDIKAIYQQSTAEAWSGGAADPGEGLSSKSVANVVLRLIDRG